MERAAKLTRAAVLGPTTADAPAAQRAAALQEQYARFGAVLVELAAMESSRGGLDEIDEENYLRACRRLPPDRVRELVKRLRYAHTFRPTAAEVEKLVGQIVGEQGEPMTAGVLASYRPVEEALPHIREDKSRLLPGTGEGPKRRRARETVARLARGEGLDEARPADTARFHAGHTEDTYTEGQVNSSDGV